MLDLVPADSEQFVVIRDLNEVLDESQWMLGAIRAPLLRAMELDGKPDEDAVRIVRDFDALRGKFATSGIDFDRGVAVIGNVLGSDVIVFSSANPEALNELFTALGGSPSGSGAERREAKMKCTTVADAAGFAACAEKDDGTLAKYKPAKAAAALRTELSKKMAGVDLEQANVVGRWHDAVRGDTTAFAISTAPGLLEVHLATKLAVDFEGFTATGPSPALALAPKGSSFVWGRFAPAFAADQAKSAPALVGNVVATLTGEYFVGSTVDPALVALVGVTDPGPAAALVPMFSLVQDQVPKSLPDGTALEMKVESIDPGTGTGVQTLHAIGTGPRADLFAKLGLVQEGVAFVAGKYGAIAVGIGTNLVSRIAAFDGGAGEAPIASVLPADLATALRDGKASLAVHLELDGMQNPVLGDAIATTLGELPPTPAGKPTPKDLLDVATGLIAPLSSLSVWTTRDGGPSIVHVAMRSFGDPASDEGKAAHAGVVEIAAGTRDAKTVYGELVGRYPSSPRAFAYRARAHGRAAAVAPAMGGVVLAGAAFFFLFLSRDEKAAAPREVEPAVPAEPGR